jgi:hypothetical protein
MLQARPGQTYILNADGLVREGAAKSGDVLEVLRRNTALSGSAAMWCSFWCKRTGKFIDLPCDVFDNAVTSGGLELQFDTTAGIQAAELKRDRELIASLRQQLALAELAANAGTQIHALA